VAAIPFGAFETAYSNRLHLCQHKDSPDQMQGVLATRLELPGGHAAEATCSVPLTPMAPAELHANPASGTSGGMGASAPARTTLLRKCA
jgi:hypothetical protein